MNAHIATVSMPRRASDAPPVITDCWGFGTTFRWLEEILLPLAPWFERKGKTGNS